MNALRSVLSQPSCFGTGSLAKRLVLRERDRPFLPNSEWAIGGVRQSLLQSEIRADYVQHALAALIECGERAAT